MPISRISMVRRGRLAWLVTAEILFTIAGYWTNPADLLLPERATFRNMRRLEVTDIDDDPLLWDDDDDVIAEARRPYQPLKIDQDDTIIEREFAAYKRLRGSR